MLGLQIEHAPRLIELLTKYCHTSVAVKDGIMVERILKDHPNMVATPEHYTNFFKYLSNVLKKIVCFEGVVCNMTFTASPYYNTAQRYRFLVRKQLFYERALDRVEEVYSKYV